MAPRDDPIERLRELREQAEHTVCGLISGTSADGVDVAITRLRDEEGQLKAELVAFQTVPYPNEIRQAVLGAAAATAAEIARLDMLLGELFAEAALSLIAGSGAAAVRVELIGSHGQTVCHQPARSGRPGFTLQLGQAAVIAERTGLPVISDFRVRDIALGGQGAPLVPLADHLLLADPGENRVLLNIGGIANITAVNGRLEDVRAFDTGPGNALLDALVRLDSGGRESFDASGARAAAGRVDEALLSELLALPFFDQPPPRSADRDPFGEELARSLLDRGGSLEDLLATAARFTACSVAREIGRLPAPFTTIDRVIASGGGVHNDFLMAELRRELNGISLETSALHGLPVDAKEAVAFAVLARQTLLGRPGNVPAATGASRPAVLGTITP